jgi:hypothetical protein
MQSSPTCEGCSGAHPPHRLQHRNTASCISYSLTPFPERHMLHPSTTGEATHCIQNLRTGQPKAILPIFASLHPCRMVRSG